MKLNRRIVASVLAMMMLSSTLASCAKSSEHHGDSNNLLGLMDGEESAETEVIDDTPTPTPEEMVETSAPEETTEAVEYANAYDEFCSRMVAAGYSDTQNSDKDESIAAESIPLIASEEYSDQRGYISYFEIYDESVDIPSGVQDFIATYNSMMNSNEDYTYLADILRADTRMLSVRFVRVCYEDYSREYFTVNIDSQSGAILNIEDVVSDMSQLSSDVETLFNNQYAEDISPDIDCANTMWSFGYEGLNIYFQKEDYELGNGYGCLTLNSTNYDSYVDSYYYETLDEYEVEINELFDVGYDIGHDGVMDVITINYDYDNANDVSLATINGEELARFDDSSNFVSYGSFVRRGNNDYMFTYTDINSSDGPARIYNLSTLEMIYETEVSEGTAFYSPDTFRVYNDIPMIGNPLGYTDYTFNADGSFTYNDDYYHIDYGFSPVVTAIDLDCQIVDEDGNVIDSIVLPAGSEIIPYRHNGYDAEDVLYGDMIVRIFFDCEEDETGYVSRTINGIPLYSSELFTNTWFAD